MDVTFLLGTIAAVLTSLSFVPQAIKTVRSGDTRAISLPMYVVFVIGIVVWLIYGFLLWEIPIILANTLTLIFSSIILGVKLRNYARGER